MDVVMARILLCTLWLLVLASLAGLARLPDRFDIYYKDRYYVINRSSLILAVSLLIVPLLVVSIRRFRLGR